MNIASLEERNRRIYLGKVNNCIITLLIIKLLMADVNSQIIANTAINQMLKHAFQYQETLLQWAVEGNNRDLVELLLLSGADVNGKDKVSRIRGFF